MGHRYEKRECKLRTGRKGIEGPNNGLRVARVQGEEDEDSHDA
jgi:hypothetical protein